MLSYCNSLTLQNNNWRCVAGNETPTSTGPTFPVCTSHCYFIYCSWPTFYGLFHVLKFKCGKHYQYPPWIFFVVAGGRKGGWVFPFPFSFLFIVECIKWSKANFRLTKFKNYFLCSDVFVWKVIPVCARQEMRIRSLVHTLGFRAEELRCAGRPERFWEKRRKTARPPSASKGSRLSCHGFGVTLWSGWLGRHPWLH